MTTSGHLRQNAAVTSFLAVLPDADQRRVRSAMVRRKFAKGTVVFHEGDPGASCHLVVSGRFAVSVTTPLGNSAVLWLHGPDDFFGELALVSESASRTATVTTLEASTTLELRRADFDQLCADHPQVLRVLVAALGDRVARTSELALSGLFRPVEQRVFHQLVLLCELYLGPDPTGTLPLHQEVVAGMAGTTRPTVNRVLKQAETDGVITLGRGRIDVHDRAALVRRAR